jgi:hypothetical protein
MLRRSHILTAGALMAFCVAPGYAVAQSSGQTYSDLRSPDARDVGRVSPPVQQPVVEIREVPSNGFDWGDAGIGAAGILAMVSIAAGFTLLVGSRRRRHGLKTAH